ncbi:MAG TPA: membrane protein insertion efficiency factor YidD [Saprospiraceae bacterium]|nr:membrane protein insertion efficiency factor YidD [Saprospiraceae bacterium]
MDFISYIFKQVFIIPIRLYQWIISPVLGPKCRFNPTCSHYMVDAIMEWGVFKGIYLGLKRIGKCHPWGKTFGDDPVPKNPHRHA